jgi:hypothetical protein
MIPAESLGRGRAAWSPPAQGGEWLGPRRRGRVKAGPKDRAASLTRPPSAAVCAAWPRQRLVRGREQGHGRGAAGEAVPSLRGALGGSRMPRRVWYSRSVGRLGSRLPSLMWSTRRPHANGSARLRGWRRSGLPVPARHPLGASPRVWRTRPARAARRGTAAANSWPRGGQGGGW